MAIEADASRPYSRSAFVALPGATAASPAWYTRLPQVAPPTSLPPAFTNGWDRPAQSRAVIADGFRPTNRRDGYGEHYESLLRQAARRRRQVVETDRKNDMYSTPSCSRFT